MISEHLRTLKTALDGDKTALTEKGVEVPEGVKHHDIPDLIGQVQSGGGEVTENGPLIHYTVIILNTSEYDKLYLGDGGPTGHYCKGDSISPTEYTSLYNYMCYWGFEFDNGSRLPAVRCEIDVPFDFLRENLMVTTTDEPYYSGGYYEDGEYEWNVVTVKAPSWHNGQAVMDMRDMSQETDTDWNGGAQYVQATVEDARLTSVKVEVQDPEVGKVDSNYEVEVYYNDSRYVLETYKLSPDYPYWCVKGPGKYKFVYDNYDSRPVVAYHAEGEVTVTDEPQSLTVSLAPTEVM